MSSMACHRCMFNLAASKEPLVLSMYGHNFSWLTIQLPAYIVVACLGFKVTDFHRGYHFTFPFPLATIFPLSYLALLIFLIYHTLMVHDLHLLLFFVYWHLCFFLPQVLGLKAWFAWFKIVLFLKSK